MAQVLVRDIAPEIVDKLKVRAQRHHHSLEAELRRIFEQAVEDPAVSRRAEVERVQALFAGRTFEDSAELLREDRER